LGATAPTVAPEVMIRVEEIWQREKAQRGDRLFNGKLFSIHACTPRAIVGRMSEYRYFLAQRRDPALHAALRIRPLAVTGVLVCRDGIVFGRRGSGSEMDGDLWELAPSGSVDDAAVDPEGNVSLAQCLIRELEEETGVCRSKLTAPPEAIALIEDLQSHVVDVALRFEVNCSGADILESFSGLRHREYAALELVAPVAVPAFRRQHAAQLGAVSAGILDIIAPQP
jgi:8-oxo-dGTP pyrophosphatase MutT (NUDIX family)